MDFSEQRHRLIGLFSLYGILEVLYVVLFDLWPLNAHDVEDNVRIHGLAALAFLITSYYLVNLLRRSSLDGRFAWLNHLLNYVATFVVVEVVRLGWTSVALHIATVTGINFNRSVMGQSAVILIGALILIPGIAVFWSRMGSWIGRIIVGSMYSWSLIVSVTEFIGEGFLHHTNGFWTSGVVGAVGLLLVGPAILRGWGFDVSWRQLFNFGKVSLGGGLMLAFGYLFYLEAYFTNMPDSWWFPFYWPAPVSFATTAPNYIFEALEAGVAEEMLWRVLALLTMLVLLKRFRFGVLYAILGQGVLFGLWHFPNITAGAPLSGVISQMVFAAGFGIVAGVMFLYTQNILVPITLHFVNDWLAFWLTDSTLADSTTFNATYFLNLLMTVIFIVGFVWFFMTGRRRELIAEHAANLTAGAGQSRRPSLASYDITDAVNVRLLRDRYMRF
jgi:membrane protease YdiL (CAAX protease family)